MNNKKVIPYYKKTRKNITDRDIRLAYYNKYRHPSVKELLNQIEFEYVYKEIKNEQSITQLWKEGDYEKMEMSEILTLRKDLKIRVNKIKSEVHPMKTFTLKELKEKLNLGAAFIFEYEDLEIKVFPKSKEIFKTPDPIIFINDKPSNLVALLYKEDYEKWYVNSDVRLQKEFKYLINACDNKEKLEIISKYNQNPLLLKYLKHFSYFSINTNSKYKVKITTPKESIIEEIPANTAYDAYYAACFRYPYHSKIEILYRIISKNMKKETEKDNNTTINSNIIVSHKKSNRSKKKNFSIKLSKFNKNVKKFQNENSKNVVNLKLKPKSTLNISMQEIIKRENSKFSKKQPVHQIVIHPISFKKIKHKHVRKICLKIKDEDKIIRTLAKTANELQKSNPDKYEIVSKFEWKQWKLNKIKPFNDGLHGGSKYTGISRRLRRMNMSHIPYSKNFKIQLVPVKKEKEVRTYNGTVFGKFDKKDKYNHIYEEKKCRFYSKKMWAIGNLNKQGKLSFSYDIEADCKYNALLKLRAKLKDPSIQMDRFNYFVINLEDSVFEEYTVLEKKNIINTEIEYDVTLPERTIYKAIKIKKHK